MLVTCNDLAPHSESQCQCREGQEGRSKGGTCGRQGRRRRLQLPAMLGCVLAVAAAAAPGAQGLVEWSTCDRSDVVCECRAGDMDVNMRCPIVKAFFEASTEGCAAQTGAGRCDDPDLLGYRSCTFRERSSQCRVSVCWAWTVSIMATCPSFFADLRSSPLSVCNATVGALGSDGTEAPYSLGVYQAERGGLADGGDATRVPACAASHGQCDEHCAAEFHRLWEDDECGAWLQDYAARTPVMTSDLVGWVERCEASRSYDSVDWLLVSGVSLCGIAILRVVFCESAVCDAVLVVPPTLW